MSYAEGFDAAQFAHLTAGLKKMNIEDIKLSAARRGEPISADIVKTRKREIYIQEYQSQLEVIEPEHGFEVVGGMEWLKEWALKDVVDPMLKGDIARVPMGILMAGASGIGKDDVRIGARLPHEHGPARPSLLFSSHPLEVI